MHRVAFYVDGFNLYFGLRAGGLHRYLWLDIGALGRALLGRGQRLSAAKYFTSRVVSDSDKMARQSTYLEALTARGGLRIYYGQFRRVSRRCDVCGASTRVPSEKMTDVNIAVELLKDAYQNRFDTAILVSADSDLVPPVRAVRELFIDKRVVLAFPPQRVSKALRHVATASMVIGRASLAKSQLPEELVRSDGFVLRRPAEWA